jgi:Virulence-associated protein E
MSAATRGELLVALYDRVRTAPRTDLNRAVTDEDLSLLASLPAADQADALSTLAGLGVQKSVLRDRLKAFRKKTFAPLRSVPDGENFDWITTLRYNQYGDPLALIDNLRTILRNLYADRLSYDAMGLRPFLDGRPLTDEDISEIRCEIGQNQRATFQKVDTRDGIVLVARQTREFHPVQEYLRGLKWDDKKRLASMANDHLRLSDTYSNLVLSRTMIAAVARGLVREHSPELGVMVKTVTILLGYQDAKKSTLWRILGGPWFGDSKVDINDRKGKITLASKWFYEFPEIDGMLSKHSNEETKAFTAQQTDDYLLPYGATSITNARSWLQVGTTNKGRFLTDTTGSTRWHVLDVRPNGENWCVNVRKLKAERDQLFAEAVREFDAYLAAQAAGIEDDENPHRWWMNREENQERSDRNENYQTENVWTPAVGRWLAGAPYTCPICRGSGKVSSALGSKDCQACQDGQVIRDPLAKDAAGTEYVTLDRVLLEALGVPLERHRSCRADLTDTLAELGWFPGPKRIRPILPGGGQGPKVTPYYFSSVVPTFAQLERKRAALAAELDATDAAVEAAAQADPTETPSPDPDPTE